VNRSLIQYSFRTGAKAIRYYVNLALLNIECSAFAFDFNISLVFIIRPLVQHRVLHIVSALVSLIFINGLPYKLKDRGHDCTSLGTQSNTGSLGRSHARPPSVPPPQKFLLRRSIKTKIKNRHAGTDGEKEKQASLLPFSLLSQHPSRVLFFFLLSLPKRGLQRRES